MAEILFYHLSTASVEQALPDLLERSLARGWRAIVRCGSEPALAMLDTALWTYREESFLPHATAEAGRAALQPVYLTTGPENPNGAEILMLALGARLEIGEATRFRRICVLFEADDAAAVAAARVGWKAAQAAGLDVRYWTQEGGRWVEKAGRGG
jgi:DNA polymerase-3 subunit chi